MIGIDLGCAAGAWLHDVADDPVRAVDHAADDILADRAALVHAGRDHSCPDDRNRTVDRPCPGGGRDLYPAPRRR